MLHLFIFSALVLANLVNAKNNLTCYECNGCSSTPVNVSIGNDICFRIQVNCVAADINIFDLIGNRLHTNHSLLSCGQTLQYLSACTITYHCCYTNKCNRYEGILVTSSSSTLFTLTSIVINLAIFSSFLLSYLLFL